LSVRTRALALVVVALVGSCVVAGTATPATPPLKVKLMVNNFVTQLHTDPISWVGPDGQLHTTDRWYEWTATFRWSHLPAGSTASLQLMNPATTDALASFDVSGLRSYTFSGTSTNAFWGFPSSMIPVHFFGCAPDSRCFDAGANVQIPD
jgi:hypothetical protein